METFKPRNILIPTDFSQLAGDALEIAGSLARKYDAALTILHVRENTHNNVIPIHPEEEFMSINNTYDNIARERLTQLAESTSRKWGVQVSPILSVGNVTSEIRQLMKTDTVDMIVMGTHGVKGIEEFFVGSNAYRTVNSVDCPVLTAQKMIHDEFKTIVVPVDDSMHSREKLPHAASLAKAYNAKIKLLSLHRSEDEDDVFHMRKIEDQVLNYFQNEGVECDKHEVNTRNLASEIIHFANYMDASLIVIMSEQEKSITGMLLGPYSQQVVNHSPIPVLTIKPKDNITIVNV